jgi:hypothetical protein
MQRISLLLQILVASEAAHQHHRCGGFGNSFHDIFRMQIQAFFFLVFVKTWLTCIAIFSAEITHRPVSMSVNFSVF